MDHWAPPQEWGVGAHAKHLKNLYVYFWRWASLKVFGSGWYAATGEKDKDRSGIVCFITAAAFLNGDGFQRMREDLRRSCAAVWVVDCSPEGHQPEVSTRIFQGVQQAVCIVLAVRPPNKSAATPAQLKFLALPSGRREIKFTALADVSLDDTRWVDGRAGWRDAFLPAQEGVWASLPPLADLFSWSGPGVMPGRTWAVSPDVPSLKRRWAVLQREGDLTSKERLFHPQLRKGKVASRHINKIVKGDLGAYPTPTVSINDDTGPLVSPIRYAFRSFDRQWLPPDSRLLNDPRPRLWEGYSPRQLYITAPDDAPTTLGPAISLTAIVPDQNHFKGYAGGSVYPLWRNPAATVSNVKPTLLAHFAKTYGASVAPEDVMAYLAAVMAHPAFTARFQKDLVRPGLRVPVTADAKLFAKATALGREVVWLHTCGERFADPKAGRPARAPRLPHDAPSIPKGGTIPGAPEPLPDDMHYDAAKRRLHIGKGYIDNVPPEVWAYEVSGMNVLRQWFSYRKRDRKRPIIGDRRQPSPLGDIQPDHWPHEYTPDLLDLLNVLGRIVALEPQQAKLLEEILSGPLIDHATLTAAGALQTQVSAAAAAAEER